MQTITQDRYTPTIYEKTFEGALYGVLSGALFGSLLVAGSKIGKVSDLIIEIGNRIILGKKPYLLLYTPHNHTPPFYTTILATALMGIVMGMVIQIFSSFLSTKEHSQVH